jgi:glutaredoxin 3
VPQQQITVYTTDPCMYCQQEKEFLRRHTMPFTEIRVDDDAAAAEDMIRRSGQMSVPFTVVNNQGIEDEISGFDITRLEKALGIQP